MENKEIEVKKEDKKEKKKFEIDGLAVISILVMAASIGIALYFLFSFGK